MIADINPGSAWGYPVEFIEYNGKLYFSADDGTRGREPWCYDPVGDSVFMIADIYPGSVTSTPESFEVYNNKLYFSARNDSIGYALFSYDGTSVEVAIDLAPSHDDGEPQYLTVYDGKLYFSADTASAHSVSHWELWHYDGTVAAQLTDINPAPNAGSGPRDLTVYNGKLYFKAYDGTHGDELWSYDGTNATLEADIRTGADGSDIDKFIVYDNKLFFAANDGGPASMELWSYDGSTATMEADIRPGSTGSNPEHFALYDGKLYFAADGDANASVELWSYDGTSATMEVDLHPTSSSNPVPYGVIGDKLYFQANEGPDGIEVWSYDGTSVALETDINTIGSGNSLLSATQRDALIFNGKLYFLGYDGGATGQELWELDPGNSCALPDACNNVTVVLDSTGTANITTADIFAGNAIDCGFSELYLDITDYSCVDTGINIATLTAITSPSDTSTCAIEVTIKSSTKDWVQRGNEMLGDSIGNKAGSMVSLSQDGNICAVGIPWAPILGDGRVEIYELTGSTWTQMGTAMNAETDPSVSGYGHAVSLSDDGNRVALGAPKSNTVNGQKSGLVRVYEYNGTDWIQLGSDILGEVADDHLGDAVMLSGGGDFIVVGAPRSNQIAHHVGYAKVYEYNGTDWVLRGSKVSGSSSTNSEQAGWSVTISDDGNRFALSAYRNDEIANDVGEVRAYEFNGTDWIPMGSFLNGEASDWQLGYGLSMSADGYRMAASAPGAHTSVGNASGLIRIYDYIAGDWTLVGNEITGADPGDFAGRSLGLSDDGSRVIIGAEFHHGTGTSSGHARVFQLEDTTWVQVGNDILGEFEEDRAGMASAISGDGVVVAVGAPEHDGIADASGQVRVFQMDSNRCVFACDSVALCRDISIPLADTAASITPEDVDSNSLICGVDTAFVMPNVFDCSNLGSNLVTLTIVDTAGKFASCTATVTVQDLTLPSAICKDVTTYLNSFGTANLTPGQVDNGSSDDCALDSLSLSQTTFNCSDIGQALISLTATDSSGNTDACNTTIAIADTLPPIALCMDATVYLDGAGGVSIMSADADNGSNDNCGIDNYGLSMSSFGCNEIGTNSVVLTIGDAGGNISTCQSIITVSDTVGPAISGCPSNISLGNDAGLCGATATWPGIISSSDNCSSTITNTHNSGDFFPAGTTTVTYIAMDDEGNATSCSFDVIVTDIEPPTATCPPSDTICNAVGALTPTASDNCSVTFSASPPFSTTVDVGETVVYTLTATDPGGNTSTCQTTIYRASLPSVNAGHDTTVTIGSTFTLGANPVATGGAPPYSYLWYPDLNLDNNTLPNPTFTANASANYTAFVIDAHGCAGTGNVSVAVAGTPVTCNRTTSVSATNITDTSATLSWSPVLGATSYIVRYQKANVPKGSIITTELTGTSLNLPGLVSSSRYRYQVRTKCTGIGNSGWKVGGFNTASSRLAENNLEITVFPNPSNGVLQVALASAHSFLISSGLRMTTIEVFDVVGRQVYHWEGNAEGAFVHPVDLSNHAQGQYMVRISVADKVISKMVSVAK